MKKLICCILTLAMLLTLGVVAYAAEVTTCTLAADSLSASAGEEITVPIRITDNPGFTNFFLRLCYDPAALTLKALENVAGEAGSVNLQGQDAEGRACAVIVGASAEAVTGDQVLFNAVFTVNTDFSGSTEVTPAVEYLRNNSATFSLFQELTAAVQPGTLEVENTIILGDVDGNGIINVRDAVLVRGYINGRYPGGEAFLKAADVNGDGKVDMRDAAMIYGYVNGKLDKFSASQVDE